MEINREQHGKMEHMLLVQRENVSVENIVFINALLYICENGCKWRRFPKEYGNSHVIYKRFNCWAKAGIIEKLFRELHVQGIMELTTQTGNPCRYQVRLDKCSRRSYQQ